LAVRPVVKKQEKGSPEWKEVELKELLDVFKELEKDEPKEVYSFDNLPECHFIKTLVKNLEHGNAKEIKVSAWCGQFICDLFINSEGKRRNKGNLGKGERCTLRKRRSIQRGKA
jgi:hypothetical protein